jgi:hypothetical protein
LHRHVALLAEFPDDVNRTAPPINIAPGIDAADLIEAATGPQREADEALEARVQRFQQ